MIPDSCAPSNCELSNMAACRWKNRYLLYGFGVIIVASVIIITQLHSLLLSEWDDDIFESPVDFNEDSDPHGKGSEAVKKATTEDIRHPIILWWTGFTGEKGKLRSCGDVTCFFTVDRHYKDHPSTKVFMFYGTDFKVGDLPLPRQAHHEWGLFHEESPKNVLLFSHEDVLTLFNHTATFRRESDYPITTQYLTSLEVLDSINYVVSTKEKNRLMREEGLALVNYVQSDCDVPSDRDHFVKMLQRYIKVDSYGNCEHNKDLPPHLDDPLEGMDHNDFYQLNAKYKFTLSMENAVCNDYITEKLWRPLTVGSVPIVFGSPKIKDYLPSSKSAIMINDFTHIEDLVKLLEGLNNNDDEYNAYLEFKHSGNTNQRLQQEMKRREWGVNDWNRPDFVSSFECFVCRRVHENLAREARGEEAEIHVAGHHHYGCPPPTTFSDHPPGSLAPSDDSWWKSPWRREGFHATALKQLVEKGGVFTERDVLRQASLLQYKQEY